MARRTDPLSSVADPCVEYLEMAEKWKLPDTLMGGLLSMREAAQTYLPQEPNESDDAYQIRLNRTPLYNAYKRTVEMLVSKVFAVPIKVGQDVDEQRKKHLENIDFEGRDLDQFSYDLFVDAMNKGLSHILVDFPVTAPGLTLQQYRDLGIRPYFTHVQAANLIGWQSQKLPNGAGRFLTQIRIAEIYLDQDSDDQFKQVQRYRVRVIYPDRWELYDATDQKINNATGNISKLIRTGSTARMKQRGWELKDSGVNTFGVIPLLTFYTNRKGFMKAEPALLDLAELNLEHWQSASDQKHILHVARVPLLFSKNVRPPEGEKIIIGPNRMINGEENSDLKYVEHNGNAITSGQTDLDKIEEKMRLYGLELLVRAGGNPTATGRSLDSAEVNNPLQRMAAALQDTLEHGLQLMNLWEGKKIEDAGTLIVNKNYGLTQAQVTDLQMLTAIRGRGDLSRETMWAELQRRQTLAEDFDPVKEKERIEKEKEQALIDKEKDLQLTDKFKEESAPPPQE